MAIAVRALAVLVTATLASPVVSEDYRAEARASVARADNPGPDGKSYGLYGTYYFGDVDADNVPLAEAAFLGRDSMISLEGVRSGVDGDYRTYSRLDSDVYISTGVPLFLSAGVTRYETLNYDPDTFEPVEGHDTAWDAAIGVVPIDGLRIATRFYEHGDYDPNVDVKYVGALANGRWFGFGVNLQKPDQGEVYWGVTADYFPNRTLRLGAAFEDGYQTLWLVAEKFITPRASLLFAYVESTLADGWRLEAAWRF